ncbi:uncharacterized protein LOC131615108 [Vicia villosa]|uniref:uncharacterized protein LOC131615108 n=1 Tax=Vicia villosa TaxID=3911 RepID=UPI00273B3C96|nr:uncharacterized protein LOC131615108 [Vicia villosa]
MDTVINSSASWIMKAILQQRENIVSYKQVWDKLLCCTRFNSSQIYNAMIDDGSRVVWRHLFVNNRDRPKAIHTTWLACHGKLGTKDRLYRFGMIHEQRCSMCDDTDENLEHLFFACRVVKSIWSYVLQWLDIQLEPKAWSTEFAWILENIAKKGWRANLLKLAFTETIYGIWRYRNDMIFGANTQRYKSIDTSKDIIENIMYRG